MKTVSQFIEELKQLPQDLPVYLEIWSDLDKINYFDQPSASIKMNNTRWTSPVPTGQEYVFIGGE